MSSISIKDLCPRPFREVVTGPFEIQARFSERKVHQSIEEFVSSPEGQLALTALINTAHGVFQIALMALSFYALDYLQYTKVTSFILGCIASPSSMVMGGSYYALSFGALSLLECIKAGSLQQFSMGMASLGLGFTALEYLDVFQIGLCDRLIKQAAEKGSSFLIHHLV